LLKTEIDTASAVLRNVGWLRDTPTAFADAILAHCHWRQVATGSAVQHAGDASNGITGLARGTVTMTTALSVPDTPLSAIGHPGQWFGIIPLVTNQNLLTSIVARGDVMLGTITSSDLDALLSANPLWWRHIGALGVIYGNLAANIAADMMIRDSRCRCVASLLRLGNCRFRDPDVAWPIEAPMTQEELAANANLSRTSVATILRDLEDQKLIRLGYRSVILDNPAVLRAIVDTDA
jgi:CRP/FNR family cyclic AMP-dependent transcriptional regulator